METEVGAEALAPGVDVSILGDGLAAVLGVPHVVLARLGVDEAVAVVRVHRGVGAVDHDGGAVEDRRDRAGPGDVSGRVERAIVKLAAAPAADAGEELGLARGNHHRQVHVGSHPARRLDLLPLPACERPGEDEAVAGVRDDVVLARDDGLAEAHHRAPVRSLVHEDPALGCAGESATQSRERASE